jgi:hypothetical protein
VGIVAKKLNIESSFSKDSPKLSLPGKLVVPSYQRTGNFSILGLGDIVVPGLLLCFVLRFDAYKRSQLYQVLIEENEMAAAAGGDFKSNPSNSGCSSSQSATDSANSKPSTNSGSSVAEPFYYSEKLYDDKCNISGPSLYCQQPHKINCDCFSCKSVSNGSNNRYHSGFTHRHNSYPSAFLSYNHPNGFQSTPSSPLKNYSIKSLIRLNKLSYFHCSLIGYFVGLITATLSSEIFREAQPALLYLVPFTLLPLLTMAYLKGDLRLMWNEPFSYTTPKYFYV